ncbi:hypothetical protein A2U01_0047015 [Trifolium medium]|uniref:Transmembrane protein n=1 Tax=Trifolium medium TaxID=97028 RepID=A0A392QPP3_9FABA|nr:hypothetical protein [Trifolium medium]
MVTSSVRQRGGGTGVDVRRPGECLAVVLGDSTATTRTSFFFSLVLFLFICLFMKGLTYKDDENGGSGGLWW